MPCNLQYLPFSVDGECVGVRVGRGQVKVRSLKENGSVIEANVEDLHLDFGRSERAEVSGPKVGNQGVGSPIPVGHHMGSLRQLDVISRAKDCAGRIWQSSDKGSKVNDALHLNELNILLPAGCDNPILHWEEDLGIGGSGGIIHDRSLGVVEQHNHQVMEVVLVICEEMLPIAHDSLRSRGCIKLSPKSVNNKLEVRGEVEKRGFVDLPSVGVVKDLHL
jgi:hypothetical protein